MSADKYLGYFRVKWRLLLIYIILEKFAFILKQERLSGKSPRALRGCLRGSLGCPRQIKKKQRHMIDYFQTLPEF